MAESPKRSLFGGGNEHPTMSETTLKLTKCPHCQARNPYTYFVTAFCPDIDSPFSRIWAVYYCAACGGAITAKGSQMGVPVDQVFPQPRAIDEAIPEKPRKFLNQAMETLFAPDVSQMASASAIDAMLKDFGYDSGSLYSRIEEAYKANLITKSMSEWAHKVREKANSSRHADLFATDPTETEARNSFEYALALAELLYVLPAKIKENQE